MSAAPAALCFLGPFLSWAPGGYYLNHLLPKGQNGLLPLGNRPQSFWLQGHQTRTRQEAQFFGPYGELGAEPVPPGHLLDHVVLLLRMQGVHDADQAKDDPLPQPERSSLRPGGWEPGYQYGTALPTSDVGTPSSPTPTATTEHTRKLRPSRRAVARLCPSPPGARRPQERGPSSSNSTCPLTRAARHPGLSSGCWC